MVVKDWQKVSNRLSRSGLVLVGEYSPCSVTDYIVGTDYILPTGGSTSRTCGVSVKIFVKRVESVKATPVALRKSLNALSKLALMEGPPNHARAAETSSRKEKRGV